MLLQTNVSIHTNINNIYRSKYSITYVKNALTVCTKKIIPNKALLKQSIAMFKISPVSYCIGSNLLAITVAISRLKLCLK